MSDTIKTYEVQPSPTTEYRREAWGIERIVLDAISNHLPHDSGGTNVSVKLKQEGTYVDLKSADPEKPVEEIVFEDDGRGYDAMLLSVLHTTKSGNPLAVGQFGEGLKLVATAALREGVQLEYRSRNWVATPFAEEEEIAEEKVGKLFFRITENGESIKGSRTVFYHPSPELVAEVLKLPQKVLAFCDVYKEVYSQSDNIDYTDRFLTDGGIQMQVFLASVKRSDLGTNMLKSYLANTPATLPWKGYNSRMIEVQAPKQSLYVKGVKVEDIDALFSYDLAIRGISPDRKHADKEEVLDKVTSLLLGCSNTDVIAKVLQKANEDQHGEYLEFKAFARNEANVQKIQEQREHDLRGKYEFENYIKKGTRDPPKNLWLTTFYKIFGENAVIASHDTRDNDDARMMGCNPVKLHHAVENHLIRYGAQTAYNIANGKKEYKWVNLEDLTGTEREMLARAREIDHIIFEKPIDIPLHVYEGLYLPSGREVAVACGVTIKRPDGSKIVGIKRSELVDLPTFAKTYIHEAGHFITGYGDDTRAFTDFFVGALAKIAAYAIGQGKGKA